MRLTLGFQLFGWEKGYVNGLQFMNLLLNTIQKLNFCLDRCFCRFSYAKVTRAACSLLTYDFIISCYGQSCPSNEV